MQTPFSPLSLGKSFMKIVQPFPRYNTGVSGIFVADEKTEKKQKKQKKTKKNC